MLKRLMMQFLILLSLALLTSGPGASLPQLVSGKRAELIHQLPVTVSQTGHDSSKSDGQFSDSFDLEFIVALKGPMLVRAISAPFSAPVVCNPAFYAYSSSGPSPPAIS